MLVAHEHTKFEQLSFSSMQPPGDPNAVTREQLIFALRNCLAATTMFAPVSIFIVLKIKHTLCN